MSSRLLLAGEGTLTCANERQGQLCEALQTSYSYADWFHFENKTKMNFDQQFEAH